MNDLEYYSVYEFVADYKDGFLSRREMMRRVIHITGGLASAAAVLSLLGCGGQAAPASSSAAASSIPPSSKPAAPASPAPASTSAAASPAASGSASAKPSGSVPVQPTPTGPTSPISVAATDPVVSAKDVTFAGNGATLMAYEARPASGSGPFPCIMVCHENMGLTEHIRDVTRRYAKEGYVAVALDLLGREGGTPRMVASDPSRIGALLSATDAVARQVGDFAATAEYYLKQSFIKPGAVGMNGFCFGGGITWRVATELTTLKAGVPFYGAPPPIESAGKIKAAMMGVYSADPQDFANNGRDALDQALKTANVAHEFKVYPGTQHAFNNDTGGRYVREQALVAWKDTLDWFAKYVKA